MKASGKSASTAPRRQVSTGYDSLDRVLEGGFPVGSAIILSASASAEVPILLRKFLSVNPEENKRHLVICKNLASGQGIAAIGSDNISFVVCGEEVSSSKNVVRGSIGNLTDLNLHISEALKAGEMSRVAIDIVSDVLLRHKALQTRKWLGELLSRLGSRQVTVLATINPYMHAREEVEAVLDLFDGGLEVVETDLGGASRKLLRVRWMHGIELSPTEFQLDLIPETTALRHPKAAGIHNVPLQVTALIGREKELVEARGLLLRDDVRLVTLIGPGGTGKTRLCLQLATQMIDLHADGVFFVPLGQISDPGLVAPTIAQTLGLAEEGGRPIVEILKDYLREKQVLLLLDNFEHLVASGPLVGSLLASCAKLKILVTSREPLHVRGEFEYFVPPLALPDLGHPLSVEELSKSPAVSLFIQRASAVRAEFALTEENARALAEICVRLDGLPLALELAAARIKLLSPHDILRHLEDRLKILTGGPRDLPQRQQTLRGAIAWSYELLTEAEKSLFRKLSVFVGGCTLEAAEAVCLGTGGRGMEVIDGLSSLMDKSLLVRAQDDDETRFGMLETIREFALEALTASGEEAEVRRRHGNLFLALAEQAEPELIGPKQGVWLKRLEREHGNIRAALQWSSKRGDVTLGIHIAAALWRFWYARGHLTEGRAWLTEVLAQSPEQTVIRAEALNGAGVLAQTQGDYSAARALYEESLAIFRKMAHKGGIAACLTNLGLIAGDQGDHPKARALYEESLAMSRQLQDKPAIARLLNNLALMAQQRGDYANAHSLCDESLAIKRELGDERGIAASLLNLGNLSRDEGDYDRAGALYEESLNLFKKIGEKRGIAYSLNNLGLIASGQSDHDGAMALFDESFPLFEELGDKLGLAACLHGKAGVASARNDFELGLRLYKDSLALRMKFGDKEGIIESMEGIAATSSRMGQARHAVLFFAAAEGLRQTANVSLPPADRADHERHKSAAREVLGEQAFAAAWEMGLSMSLEEALALAMETSSKTG